MKGGWGLTAPQPTANCARMYMLLYKINACFQSERAAEQQGRARQKIARRRRRRSRRKMRRRIENRKSGVMFTKFGIICS